MSLVLVVARPAAPSIDAPTSSTSPGDPDEAAAAAVARTDIWRAVRDEVAGIGARGRGALDGLDGLDGLAAAIAADEEDPRVTYAADPDAAVAAVERSIEAGADAIAVVPVALAVDGPADALSDPGLAHLHSSLEAVGRRHRDVDLQYIGPPFHHAPALEAAIAALRPPGSEEPALLAGAVGRAFDGDLDRFGRFMAALQAGIPTGTGVILRGSAVQGISYKTGEPFDARGPRTSDLDIVLLGEDAMAAWRPDAFYLAGVNTQPLDDGAPDIADPRLERARREAQAAAGRPVALQAMARWFLDLRSGLQGTPYVVLAG